MKQRLHYFDMLKGIAIFMVVMGHVLTMCVREIDRAPIFKMIGEVHMPLFFFISGWFAMRAAADKRPQSPALLPRARRLLLPMIVVSSIWIWYFPLSGIQSPLDSTFEGLWSGTWKNGYWFTFVLFEITVGYALTTLFMGRRPSLWREIGASALVWAVFIALAELLPAEAVGYASLDLSMGFFPVFMAGAIARRHSDAFNNLCASSTALTIAMIVAVGSFFLVGWPWKYPWLSEFGVTLCRVVLQISLAIVAIGTVKPWSERAFAPEAPAGTGRIARMWEYIGTRSLAIYLLHYFFLFPLGSCREALVSVNLNFVPLAVFAATIAAAVVAVVLCVDWLICFSRPLGFLLTGTEPPKAKA